MVHIYPRPIELNENKVLGTISRIHYSDPLGSWKKEWCGNFLTAGEMEVEVYLDHLPPHEGFLKEKRHLIQEEGYFIQIKEISEKKAVVWITANSDRGYFYAFQTWNQLIKRPLEEGWVLDFPRMGRRGWVEGYYGAPWSHEKRIRALDILSGQKMNTYVYAPKNDRYHREVWAELYPPEELARLASLIQHCQKVYIDFVFAVSPGLSMEYSSALHIQSLYQKFKQLYQLGVRHFGLFLDDIPLTLMHEADRTRFGDLAEAHIQLTQDLYGLLKDLNPLNQLLVCPTQYFGKGDEDYITRLGNALPEDIQLFWTGRTICSPEIDVREARIFYEQTSHQALYWDNYPVNDANMRDEMHIGPFINRHPQLYLYSSGLIANVMEYAEASLIPLITIAHYLWNPKAYDAQVSYRYATEQIVGERLATEFTKISDCFNQSPISSLPGSELLMRWLEHQRKWPSDPTAHEQFKQVVREYQSSAQQLFHMENTALLQELSPWVQKVVEDLQYLMDVLEAPTIQEMEKIAEKAYRNQVQALGFFPYLISSELINQKKK